MGFEDRRHGPSMARPVLAVTATVLSGFIFLSLGALFFGQAKARWSQARRLESALELLAPRSPVEPQHYAKPPKLKLSWAKSPPPPPPPPPPFDAEVDPFARRSSCATLTISLDGSGNILADGERRTPSDLREMLRAAELGSDGDSRAVLAVDGRCPSEYIALVKRICDDAGTEITQVRKSVSGVDSTPQKIDAAVDTSGSQA